MFCIHKILLHCFDQGDSLGKNSLFILNILTGKFIAEYQFQDKLCYFGARYLSALKVLVIPSYYELVIYDVIGQLGLLKVMFTHKFRENSDKSMSMDNYSENRLVNMYYSGNMILIIHVKRQAFARAADVFFQLYQVSRDGIKEYKVDTLILDDERIRHFDMRRYALTIDHDCITILLECTPRGTLFNARQTERQYEVYKVKIYE